VKSFPANEIHFRLYLLLDNKPVFMSSSYSVDGYIQTDRQTHTRAYSYFKLGTHKYLVNIQIYLLFLVLRLS